jgi:thioredoxin reductase (NADPH)
VNSRYDIIIIGAGPAGLSCAIEAQKAAMKYLVVDKGGVVNSIQQFARDMPFFSTPELLEVGGIPFVIPSTRPTSLDCVNYYRSVAEHYRLHCRFFEPVVGVEKRNGGFALKTAHGTELETRAVVIATGYYDTPSLLGVPGEQLPRVSHYYRDALPYFQQDVLVVGGKNSAVEAALDLWRHGARVTVVHRGQALSSGVKYWILPDFQNRVTDGSITVHFGCTVGEFLPGRTIVQESTGNTLDVRTDFAFVLIGYRPNVDFMKSIGIEVNEDSLAPVHNAETMETNVPNVFVAGGLVGGRFNNKIFIENGREHGKRIVASLK